MGNYVSCTLSPNSSRLRKGAKVIFPDGEIRPIDQPVNAAELMLEMPTHFLVNTSSLHIGRRFPALAADEDLEMGNVYMMFPMRRVNSMVTPADMGTMLVLANSALRRSSRGKLARVLPEVGGAPRLIQAAESSATNRQENQGPRLNLEEIEDESVGEFQARLSMCRSRRPRLETIAEETVIGH